MPLSHVPSTSKPDVCNITHHLLSFAPYTQAYKSRGMPGLIKTRSVCRSNKEDYMLDHRHTRTQIHTQ